MEATLIPRVTATCALLALALTSRAAAQASKHDVTYRAPGGTTLRLLLDEHDVGEAVSVGELTFAPNGDSGEHRHGAIEIFYVLSGELEHVVNGASRLLTAGMVGYVKPPDTIRHKTGAAGAKVVVIWVPGDEARKIVARWSREP